MPMQSPWQFSARQQLNNKTCLLRILKAVGVVLRGGVVHREDGGYGLEEKLWVWPEERWWSKREVCNGIEERWWVWWW